MFTTINNENDENDVNWGYENDENVLFLGFIVFFIGICFIIYWGLLPW